MYEQFLNEFKKNHPNRQVLFLCKAGSHFFDLNTANSDSDFRGIYLPSPEEFYEGEGRRRMSEYKTQAGNQLNVRNKPTDVDFTMFSITKFLDLLASGDFNCIELLHTPEDKIIIDSSLMKELRDIRKSLIVNDISAFLGFIRKEYKRYGVNIHHYDVQEKLLNFLKTFDGHLTMKDIWSDIRKYAENDSFISFTESQTGNKNYVPSLKIAQRLYQNTVRVEYVREALEERLKTYGHRQRSNAKDGKEFKGLYHAQRLIYEASDIFDYGEMKIPFDMIRHEWLMEIKNGTVNQEILFDSIDRQIEELYIREKNTVTNKKQVKDTIDRIIFSIEGKMRINFLTKNNENSLIM